MYSREEIRDRLAFAIPSFWQDILEAKVYQDASADEFAKLWDAFYVFLDGRYPQLATTELYKWEMLLGLSGKEVGAVTWDENDDRTIAEMEGQTWGSLEYDYDSKRAAILSRLRGFGTFTKKKLIESAATYTGGSVTVTEFYGEHHVLVEFADIYGVPKRYEAFKILMHEAVPAHILLEFKLKYLQWQEFDQYNWTFVELDRQSLIWAEFDNLQPLEGGN